MEPPALRKTTPVTQPSSPSPTVVSTDTKPVVEAPAPTPPKVIEPTIPIPVQAVIQTVTKKFGPGSIFAGLEGNKIAEVEFFSSGCLSLDIILGGGLGKGRIIEVYGPESSGKTTLALHSIAAAQAAFPDRSCAFVDAEHALDRNYAKALSVNLKTLLLAQPDYGEQALEVVDMLVRSGGCSLIVVDSVAALVPKAELEGEVGDSHMGLHARLMSQAMRKLTGIIQKSNTSVIFINQLRSKIGVFFGNPETTTGGNALKFYASQRIDIRRIGAEKVGDEVVANKTKLKVVKNKLAPPFREAEVIITYGQGINRFAELIDLGSKYNVIQKGGAWFTYKNERWQGKANAMNFLEANPEVAQKLETEIKEELKKRQGVL